MLPTSSDLYLLTGSMPMGSNSCTSSQNTRSFWCTCDTKEQSMLTIREYIPLHLKITSNGLFIYWADDRFMTQYDSLAFTGYACPCVLNSYSLTGHVVGRHGYDSICGTSSYYLLSVQIDTTVLIVAAMHETTFHPRNVLYFSCSHAVQQYCSHPIP